MQDKEQDTVSKQPVPLKRILSILLPRVSVKAFGFTKKDERETIESLADNMNFVAFLASIGSFLLGIVFLVFTYAPVWDPTKVNIYNTSASWVLFLGSAVAVILLAIGIFGKTSHSHIIRLIGDLFFRLSVSTGMLLFFTSDLVNGDLSQTDTITAAMGLLIFLALCQPGYALEALLFDVSVIICTVITMVYGVINFKMYAADQYVLFLIGFAIFSYVTYCAYWYVEAQRHYISLRNADLLSRSTHDPLTGARNRQGLRYYLDDRMPGWIAKGETVLVAMTDIDDFKLYNDTFGHLEGDEVLIAIVHALKTSPDLSHIRIFRYGGEEFLIVRTNLDQEEAESILEHAREAVENLHFPAPLEAKGPYLTISLGGALWKVDNGYSFHDQIEDSDEALYEAKRAGKNKSVLRTKLPKKEMENPETISLVEEEK